jgi:hypothetical protein
MNNRLNDLEETFEIFGSHDQVAWDLVSRRYENNRVDYFHDFADEVTIILSYEYIMIVSRDDNGEIEEIACGTSENYIQLIDGMYNEQA